MASTGNNKLRFHKIKQIRRLMLHCIKYYAPNEISKKKKKKKEVLHSIYDQLNVSYTIVHCESTH